MADNAEGQKGIFYDLGGVGRPAGISRFTNCKSKGQFPEVRCCCRLLCIKASGFARLHAQSESSGAPIPLKAVPVGDLQWAVEWRVGSCLPCRDRQVEKASCMCPYTAAL